MPRARRDPASAAVPDAQTDDDVAAMTPDEVMTVAEEQAVAEAESSVAADAEATAAREAEREAGMVSPPPKPEARSGGVRPASPGWPGDDTFVAGGPSITETEPGHIQMVQASAADIRATTVEAHQSAAARVTAGSVSLSQGASGFVRGGEVHIEQAAVGALAGDHVEFREGFAMLVIARRASGHVTVLFDWRGLAAAVAVLLVLGRLLRGRG